MERPFILVGSMGLPKKLSVERQLAILLENQLLLTKIVRELADSHLEEQRKEEGERHEQKRFPSLGYIG